MPTPSKPYAVIKGEKRSHRTKEELNQRKQAEDAMSSKEKIRKRKEVRENRTASKEFDRVQKLLDKIDKNDALYEAVINRYCILQAECQEIEERRNVFFILIKELEDKINKISREDKQDFFLELTEVSGNILKLAGHMNACDKLLLQKRKMLLDIEKENIMTIAAMLRSVPKKTTDKVNPLYEALGG